MSTSASLFSAVLGHEVWQRLPSPLREMHGDEAWVRARGCADVDGAIHFPARWVRRLLHLPSPGSAQRLEVTIERVGTREVWTRSFEQARMQSRLDTCGAGRAMLCEQLGPVTLQFTLRCDSDGVDWIVQNARFLRMPIPKVLLGRVTSRCDVDDGRYRFQIDVRVPLMGKLVSYKGWLERLADA